MKHFKSLSTFCGYYGAFLIGSGLGGEPSNITIYIGLFCIAAAVVQPIADKIATKLS